MLEWRERDVQYKGFGQKFDLKVKEVVECSWERVRRSRQKIERLWRSIKSYWLDKLENKGVYECKGLTLEEFRGCEAVT